VLCRRLQACQLLVVDSMIGVHRLFYHFLPIVPSGALLLLGLPLKSFSCNSDFLTFVVFVGFPSSSKLTHTHIKCFDSGYIFLGCIIEGFESAEVMARPISIAGRFVLEQGPQSHGHSESFLLFLSSPTWAVDLCKFTCK
jgi:hypothetical protein